MCLQCGARPSTCGTDLSAELIDHDGSITTPSCDKAIVNWQHQTLLFVPCGGFTSSAFLGKNEALFAFQMISICISPSFFHSSGRRSELF